MKPTSHRKNAEQLLGRCAHLHRPSQAFTKCSTVLLLCKIVWVLTALGDCNFKVYILK